MKAVVLAAGEGRRMRPLTWTRPKVMLPMAGKPILEHLLLNLREAGIRDLIFVVGYFADKVREHFERGERWDARIEYVLQKRQLGTADALRQVRELLREEVFLVINGDVIVGAEDIKRMIEGEPPLMGLHRGSPKEEAGFAEVRGDKVLRIWEKTEVRTPLVNTGVYLLNQEIFEAIEKIDLSPRGEYELTDALQILAQDGKLRWVEIEKWSDFSYPWDLLGGNELLLENIQAEILGEVEEGAVIRGKVRIGRGTIVRAGSYIIGPVLIGENCEIGPNCFIRPFTSIGDNCHIGAACEVKNSIIMRGTKIPHLNYVGDSIIGEDCNLGAGTKIANLRLDRRNVKVQGRDTRRKLGAIIGDKVKTGINVTINAGTLIGPETLIGPGISVSGVIEPNSKIL